MGWAIERNGKPMLHTIRRTKKGVRDLQFWAWEGHRIIRVEVRKAGKQPKARSKTR